MNITKTHKPTKKLAETIVAGVMVYTVALGTLLYSSGYCGGAVRVDERIIGHREVATSAQTTHPESTEEEDSEWSMKIYQFVAKMAIANQQ